MGRRKRKAAKIVRRSLPELYLCPRCGKNTVKASINRKRDKAVVICSSCNLKSSFMATAKMGEVDAYCRFVDSFYTGETREEPLVG